MAYEAILSVAGEDINIFEFHVSLQQANDDQGKPASGVFTGDIFLMLEAGNDLFFEWLCDQTRMESGKIKTKQTDQDSTFVEYSFEKAFVTDVSESYIGGEGIVNRFNQVSDDENESNAGLGVMNITRSREKNYQPLLSAYKTNAQFPATNREFVLFVYFAVV